MLEEACTLLLKVWKFSIFSCSQVAISKKKDDTAVYNSYDLVEIDYTTQSPCDMCQACEINRNVIIWPKGS